MNDQQYKKQVALLLRILPLVYKITDFAVHGGTAINLFHRNMPRYSVDIDLTYIPIEPRTASLEKINQHLGKLKNREFYYIVVLTLDNILLWIRVTRHILVEQVNSRTSMNSKVRYLVNQRHNA